MQRQNRRSKSKFARLKFPANPDGLSEEQLLPLSIGQLDVMNSALRAYERNPRDTRRLWEAYVSWGLTGRPLVQLPKPLMDYFMRICMKLALLTAPSVSPDPPTKADLSEVLEISRSTFSASWARNRQIAFNYGKRFIEDRDRTAAEEFCKKQFDVSVKTVRRAIKQHSDLLAHMPIKMPRWKQAVDFYLACQKAGDDDSTALNKTKKLFGQDPETIKRYLARDRRR